LLLSRPELSKDYRLFPNLAPASRKTEGCQTSDPSFSGCYLSLLLGFLQWNEECRTSTVYEEKRSLFGIHFLHGGPVILFRDDLLSINLRDHISRAKTRLLGDRARFHPLNHHPSGRGRPSFFASSGVTGRTRRPNQSLFSGEPGFPPPLPPASRPW